MSGGGAKRGVREYTVYTQYTPPLHYSEDIGGDNRL